LLFELSSPSALFHYLLNGLLYAMARRLDPKLEQIIEDASRNAQSLDTSDPSAITDDFTRTVLNSHLERCQPMGEPGIMVADFQKGHSILNNFGKIILSKD